MLHTTLHSAMLAAEDDQIISSFQTTPVACMDLHDCQHPCQTSARGIMMHLWHKPCRSLMLPRLHPRVCCTNGLTLSCETVQSKRLQHHHRQARQCSLARSKPQVHDHATSHSIYIASCSKEHCANCPVEFEVTPIKIRSCCANLDDVRVKPKL